jgi:Icc-related predicted phosphoesterase
MPRRKKVKIWHIGDTHTYHRLLKVPKNIDLVIFSGDCSNPRDRYKNEPEVREFMLWFANLPIKHKIFVAGNHDTSIFYKLYSRNDFIARGVTYLEDEYAYVEDLKIFGSPYTPTFGDWVFNKARHNMNEIWKEVDTDTDIIISHGPPKGILDATVDFNNYIKPAGDVSLKRHVLERIKPKLVCFGHLHNNEDIINAGVVKLSAYDTIFSNGSVVTDGKFGKLSSNGNIIEI